MRLLFIAGSLEPGHTGVGDYTRLLAAACARLGHECHVLALNDAWTCQICEQPFEHSGFEISVTRLSEGATSREKEESLRLKIDEFDPDWISLQFVPYGFDRRGLVWPKMRRLGSVFRGRRLHVMFHETWIGDYAGAPWKQRWLGRLQRRMIQSLMRSLQPTLLHTSNALYQRLLATAGIDARLMSIFGTIPIRSDSADQWLFPLLQSRGIPITLQSRINFWLLGFFGSIHSGFSMRDLVADVERAAGKRGQVPVLFSLGNLGSGAHLWEEAERLERAAVHLVRLGHQSEERISQLLNSLELGLSSTPLDIIGKSSSVFAMLEHGLPVVAMDDGPADSIRAEWPEMGVLSRREFFANERYLESFPRRRGSGADGAAAKFLSSLKPYPTLAAATGPTAGCAAV